MPVKYAPDNQDRLMAAHGALNPYALRTGRVKDGGPPSHAIIRQHAITDLLTDLRHYCAASGENFDQHLLRSLEHFNAEIAP